MSALAAQIGAAAQAAGSSSASSFGTGLGSGLSDAIFGGIAARRQWRYQQKQMALQQRYALEQMAKSAEYQLRHDKAMFDYENAYNEPSKVFARFLAAGVSPAAVLGSSGASLGATIATGSGSAPSASGPSGGSGVVGAGRSFVGDPTAIAEIELSRSASDRNRAAAERDKAEADDIRSKLQAPEYYSTMAELNRQITAAGVDNARAVSRMNEALADLYKADAEYADLAATYKFQDLVALYSRHVEEYNEIKSWNVNYMDRIYSAQIALDYARAYAASKSGDLASTENDLLKVNLKDVQNWFDLNWNTPILIPQVTASGKPTGKHVKMTGKQIHEYLFGIGVSYANQDLIGNWFSNRSEKNAFGYSMARTALQGALSIAAAGVAAKGFGAGVSATTAQTGGTSSAETTEYRRYDRSGEYIGGTRVTRNIVGESHSASQNRKSRR